MANIDFGEFRGNQHVGSANLPTPKISKADAARLLNVSDRTVGNARKVLTAGTADAGPAPGKTLASRPRPRRFLSRIGFPILFHGQLSPETPWRRRLHRWLSLAVALVLLASFAEVGIDARHFLSGAVSDGVALSTAGDEIKAYGRHNVESRARVASRAVPKLDGWPPGPDAAALFETPALPLPDRSASRSDPQAAVRASFAPTASARSPPATRT